MQNSSLDTSIQVAHKELINTAADTVRTLKKKAIRLHNTYKLIYPLIDLHSPLENQYWDSYHCCRELKQEGVYLRAHYCNKRWCFECNAIRCAKMINGYMPVFKEFRLPMFVTLTRPNVSSDQLHDEISDLIYTFRLTLKYLNDQKKFDVKGIRKLEVTYNWKLSSYHPHFHLIVDSPDTAHRFVNEWLFRNPEASPDAQDIRKADKSSFLELFKYAAKICADDDMSIYAKDIIFQALSGKRIYQPFGIKKKISEDVEDTVSQAYGMLNPFEIYKVWYFNDRLEDWNSLSGESLLSIILNFNSS